MRLLKGLTISLTSSRRSGVSPLCANNSAQALSNNTARRGAYAEQNPERSEKKRGNECAHCPPGINGRKVTGRVLAGKTSLAGDRMTDQEHGVMRQKRYDFAVKLRRRHRPLHDRAMTETRPASRTAIRRSAVLLAAFRARRAATVIARLALLGRSVPQADRRVHQARVRTRQHHRDQEIDCSRPEQRCTTEWGRTTTLRFPLIVNRGRQKGKKTGASMEICSDRSAAFPRIAVAADCGIVYRDGQMKFTSAVRFP